MREISDLAFLMAVRHRIRVPQLWCKGAYESGVRRCLVGAGAEVMGVDLEREDRTVEERLKRLLLIGRAGWAGSVIRLNDFSTHAQVMAKLDEGIKRLQEKENDDDTDD